MSSTLISGDNEAILIDASLTNGQADALAKWARASASASPPSASPTGTPTTGSV